MGTIVQARVKRQSLCPALLHAEASYQVVGPIGWSRTLVMHANQS
jgi:hypothetical protein